MNSLTSKRNIPDISIFRPVSLGRVAANKALGDDRLLVTLIEHMPFLSSDIHTDPQTVEIKGVDPEGNAYTDSFQHDITVEARWLPYAESNRATPPDMRIGEEVTVYQLADDTETYYWVDNGRFKYLRRLETVICAFSATRDESVTELTSENSYYFEISTHQKRVTFETSKADGEPFKYSIQLDIMAGKVIISDDINNYILLNSKQKLITLHNTYNTAITLKGKDITLGAKGNFTGVVDKKYTYTAESFNYNGDFTVNGNLSVSGNISCASLGCTGVASVGKLISQQSIVAPNV